VNDDELPPDTSAAVSVTGSAASTGTGASDQGWASVLARVEAGEQMDAPC
jgi:hypothetical protein